MKTLPELVCSVFGHNIVCIARFKREEGGGLSYIEGTSTIECSKCGTNLNTGEYNVIPKYVIPK